MAAEVLEVDDAQSVTTDERRGRPVEGDDEAIVGQAAPCSRRDAIGGSFNDESPIFQEMERLRSGTPIADELIR
jgi:hypothetical protein